MLLLFTLQIILESGSTLLPWRGDWYWGLPCKKLVLYHPSGCRNKYLHCGSCQYKTLIMERLKVHKKKECKPPVQKSYCWSLCGFRSNQKYSLDNHIKKHEQKSEHQCQLCSFSASALGALTRHQNHDHGCKSKNAQQSKVANIFTIILFAFFLRESI